MPMLSLLFATSVAAASVPDPGLTLDGDAGKPMPLLGFGTCCRKSAKGPPLIESTKAFLKEGGRLIDTAMMYGNHADLAVALREGGVAREDVWLTSKVNTHKIKTREATLQAVRTSASDLGVSYLDLMLIHGLWVIDEAEAVEIWRGLIDAKAAGLVRHIGVSNFDERHIQRLVTDTGVRPAAIQLEYHPWVSEEVHALVSWCQKQGIAVTAYGSLGGSQNQARGKSTAAVAAAHGVTPAQLLLRWATNRGVAVIPGATSVAHIRENLNLPDMSMLNSSELERLGASRPPAFRSWANMPSEIEQRKASGRGRSRKKRG